MMTTRLFASLMLSGLLLGACSDRPDYVLDTDDMAEVMADLYMAESVVELNHMAWHDDSARMALKQSIVESRGFTLAELDSSFVWYGAHLKEYDAVHDKTLEVLAGRLHDLDNAPAAEKTDGVGSDGTKIDSTNMWPGAPVVTVSERSPRRVLTFDLGKPKDTRRGDMLTWRLKMNNNTGEGRWVVAVDYTDGNTEVIPLRFSGDGWKQITLYADSTREPQRFYGSLMVSPAAATTMVIDSIELVRKRLDPHIYNQRYRQRISRVHGSTDRR